ncbi:MAG: tetratricopeptide repeat protein [Dehalococcoidia bacterium]|nr:tetratricopeptide repeat protein [Dehalococcoidia bacterium]
MAYQQEEGRTGLSQRLDQEAVALALEGRWEEAVEANKSMIERFPNDVAAYNRLGRALTEMGEYDQARDAYGKALALSPGNVIAAKNLARLAVLAEPNANVDGSVHQVASEFFITEMGKAGVVRLCHLASREVVARMGAGAKVNLVVEGQRLVVQNEEGEYLGEVEPKHELRLVKLILGGNRYAGAMLRAGEDGAQVIIREEYQHPSQAGQASFPTVAIRQPESYAKGLPMVRDLFVAEGDVDREGEYVEEEGGYSDDEEKALLEGFSVLEETGSEGGIAQ